MGWGRDPEALELEITNTSDRPQAVELFIGPKPPRAPELGRRLAAAAWRGAVVGFALGFALAWWLLR